MAHSECTHPGDPSAPLLVKIRETLGKCWVHSKCSAAGITDVIITYDVACQWGINLAQCLLTYDIEPSINLNSLDSCRVAISGFHIIGHALFCQACFNLAYMDGVGKTHREGVETICTHSGSITIYTRENRPNACHLILDDHWNRWNWLTFVQAPSSLPCLSELVNGPRSCARQRIQ